MTAIRPQPSADESPDDVYSHKRKKDECDDCPDVALNALREPSGKSEKKEPDRGS
jgi:hypothetical protein